MRHVVGSKCIGLQHGAVGRVESASPVNGAIPLGPHVERFVPRRGGNDGALVGVNVVQLWLSSLLGLANPNRLSRYQLRDFTAGVTEITGNDCVLGADHDAGGLQAHFGAMSAEVALGRGAIVGIDINGIVWAGLHTGFATDTEIGTEVHDAVPALVHRADRTNGDTRGLLAMIATRDLKDAARVRELAFLDVLDPGAIHAYGDLVLGFAGHGAGVATDAPAIVDDESVFHSEELWKNGIPSVTSMEMAVNFADAQRQKAPRSPKRNSDELLRETNRAPLLYKDEKGSPVCWSVYVNVHCYRGNTVSYYFQRAGACLGTGGHIEVRGDDGTSGGYAHGAMPVSSGVEHVLG